MNILLLGANGRTGRHILQEAIERGHQVNAIVRDASRIKFKHDRLTLFEGLPTESSLIEKAMQESQAVLCALNVSRKSDWPWAGLRSPKDLVSQSIMLLIEHMEKKQVSRILSISAWGTHETWEELPSWFRWLIHNSNIRYPYADHEKQETLLGKSDLDFTVLRPVGLSNGGKKKKVVVSFQNDPKPSFLISRKNVASFMLDCLEMNLYVQERPTISEH